MPLFSMKFILILFSFRVLRLQLPDLKIGKGTLLFSFSAFLMFQLGDSFDVSTKRIFAHLASTHRYECCTIKFNSTGSVLVLVDPS